MLLQLPRTQQQRCWWKSPCSPKHCGVEIPHVAAHCRQLIVSFLIDNFFREWLTLVWISSSVRTLGAAARQRDYPPTLAMPVAVPSPCHTEEMVWVVPTATQGSRAAHIPIRKLWALEKDRQKWIESSSFWGRGKRLTLKGDNKQQREQYEFIVSNFSFTGVSAVPGFQHHLHPWREISLHNAVIPFA